jgi:hypothetical protein
MKPIVTAAALVAILAVCGQAAAQGGPGRGGMGAMLDTNKDGVVTKAEFDAGRVTRFTAMDANKDGVLTAAEMTAGRPARPAGAPAPQGDQMMLRADANKDGKISKDEFAATGARQWAQMDANKDGKIDQKELASMRGMRGGPGQGNNGG